MVEVVAMIGWGLALIWLGKWIIRVARQEKRKARDAETRRMFAQYLEEKYKADVSEEQKEEWRTSRWD